MQHTTSTWFQPHNCHIAHSKQVPHTNRHQLIHWHQPNPPQQAGFKRRENNNEQHHRLDSQQALKGCFEQHHRQQDHYYTSTTMLKAAACLPSQPPSYWIGFLVADLPGGPALHESLMSAHLLNPTDFNSASPPNIRHIHRSHADTHCRVDSGNNIMQLRCQTAYPSRPQWSAERPTTRTGPQQRLVA